MAYTAPTTRSDGFVVDANTWNTEIVNNILYLQGHILTGRIADTGAITAGTGFTCNKSATGVYDITYTVAYGAVPLVLATQATSTTGYIAWVGASSTTGCTIKIKSDAGSAIDQPFNFMVRDVV